MTKNNNSNGFARHIHLFAHSIGFGVEFICCGKKYNQTRSCWFSPLIFCTPFIIGNILHGSRAVVVLSIPSLMPLAFMLEWCFNCCYLHLITCIPNLHYSWDEAESMFISIHFDGMSISTYALLQPLLLLLLLLLFILWHNYVWCHSLKRSSIEVYPSQCRFVLGLFCSYWKCANYRYTNKTLPI